MHQRLRHVIEAPDRTDVLYLVLEHSDICFSKRDLCTMLKTSNQLTAHLTMRLTKLPMDGPDFNSMTMNMTTITTKLQPFGRWLNRYGVALHSLTLYMKPVKQPFCHFDLEPLADSLIKATTLKQLSIKGLDTRSTKQLVPRLQALTNLTSLVLDDIIIPRAGVLSTLPQRLQALKLGLLSGKTGSGSGLLGYPRSQWQGVDKSSLVDLKLHRLTALTALDIAFDGANMLDVNKGVTFPRRLVSLAVADLSDVQPLLQLRDLQELTVDMCCLVQPQDLSMLSGLTQLTSLQLQYKPLSSAFCNIVAKLTNLCSLSLHRCAGVTCSPAELGMLFSSKMQRVLLSGQDDEDEATASVAAVKAAAHAAGIKVTAESGLRNVNYGELKWTLQLESQA